MEGSVQNKERLWTKRRHAKQLKLEMANQYTDGVVIPTQDIIKVLETLITPGDKVVLEGNNQKQADFLSRSLAQTNPDILHDLHMIMPSVGRSEHLDLFEKALRVSSIFLLLAHKVCVLVS